MSTQIERASERSVRVTFVRHHMRGAPNPLPAVERWRVFTLTKGQTTKIIAGLQAMVESLMLDSTNGPVALRSLGFTPEPVPHNEAWPLNETAR